MKLPTYLSLIVALFAATCSGNKEVMEHVPTTTLQDVTLGYGYTTTPQAEQILRMAVAERNGELHTVNDSLVADDPLETYPLSKPLMWYVDGGNNRKIDEAETIRVLVHSLKDRITTREAKDVPVVVIPNRDSDDATTIELAPVNSKLQSFSNSTAYRTASVHATRVSSPVHTSYQPIISYEDALLYSLVASVQLQKSQTVSDGFPSDIPLVLSMNARIGPADLVETLFADASPKVRHLVAQTNNALSVGYLDAAVKAGWVQSRNSRFSDFWKAGANPIEGFKGNGTYGSLIVNGLQVGSALEYGSRNGESFIETFRYFLGQAALSSVVEHLGYWTYVNSGVSVNDWRGGGTFNWRRGPRYPDDEHGHNDVPWMAGTPAGWMNQIAFDDSPGTVRKEAIFISLPVLYAFSYAITPGKDDDVEQNRIFSFEPVFYFDGNESNKGPGLYFESARMGLVYTFPFSIADRRLSSTFYQTGDLQPRLDVNISPENGSEYIGVTFGQDDRRAFYIDSLTASKLFGRSGVFFSISPSEKQYTAGFGIQF